MTKDLKKIVQEMSEDELKQVVEEALLSELKTSRELRVDFQEGQVVATPQGRGVVNSSHTDDFEFPTEPEEGVEESDEGVEEISASSDSPAFVVALGGDMAVYRTTHLEDSRFPDEGEAEEDVDEPQSTDGSAVATGPGDIGVTPAQLPEGWDEMSLLSYYASMGSSVEDIEEDLADGDEFTQEEAVEMAARMKDMALGTGRWRGRF